MSAATPDPGAWTSYLRRVNAAQDEKRRVTTAAQAAFDEATKAEREARDAVVKPAEAAFEQERRDAWSAYKARVAAEDYNASLLVPVNEPEDSR